MQAIKLCEESVTRARTHLYDLVNRTLEVIDRIQLHWDLNHLRGDVFDDTCGSLDVSHASGSTREHTCLSVTRAHPAIAVPMSLTVAPEDPIVVDTACLVTIGESVA